MIQIIDQKGGGGWMKEKCIEMPFLKTKMAIFHTYM